MLGRIIEADYTNDEVLAELINIHPAEAGFYINLADDFLSREQTAKALFLYCLAMLADPELPLAKLKLAEI